MNLISWKYSFEKISKDLELARKKKQALDDLFNSGKISASTYESLDKELTGVISDIEARQKDLADKMTSKIADLDEQIGTLEMFLANSEIQYAAGEIDDELHANESSAFSLGLDAVKKQLVAIKEVVSSLMPEVVAPPPPSTPIETEEAPLMEEIVEETTEIPVETPVEETPVEETIEVEPVSEEVVSDEVAVEEPLETPTEEVPAEEVVEVTTEEVAEVTAAEEVAEIPSSEEPIETLPETPAEETLVEEEATSEEVFEEPVMTEFPAETVGEETVTEEEAVVEEETAIEEEAVIEEEAEGSTEETSSYEEEEATTEEEAYESY